MSTSDNKKRPAKSNSSSAASRSRKKTIDKINTLDDLNSRAHELSEKLEDKIQEKTKKNSSSIPSFDFQKKRTSFSLEPLKYMMLFLKSNGLYIVTLFIAMLGLLIISDQLKLSLYPQASFGESVIFKAINILVVSSIGMMCLRHTVLNARERQEISFFSGFSIFLMLHIMINVFSIAGLLIIASFTMGEDSSLDILSLFPIGALIVSGISSIILVRFGFLVSAKITLSDDNVISIMDKVNPYAKFLLVTFCAIKFIALLAIFFPSLIVSGLPLVIIQSLIIVAYHIFTYVLLGTSYRLITKFAPVAA